MDSVLEKMSSAQILGAIGIVVTGVVALALILSITRYQLRSLEDETALKRERQQGELALRTKLVEQGLAKGERDIEALLTDTTPVPPPEPGASLDGELAAHFGSLDLPQHELESLLALALAADPERKRAMVVAISQLSENYAEPATILAVVRPLCASPKRSPATIELL